METTGRQRIELQKQAAARAALDFVAAGTYLGVGSGSTAALFVGELAASGITPKGAVASSADTGRLLAEAGIAVVDLRDVGRVPVYVDGADEADGELRLIKGGGGALTREKIVACSADLFVCIVDESKLVDRLGSFPLPIEIIPIAAVHVARRISRLGGHASEREGFTTDNGNIILDVTGLDMRDPIALEHEIDGIAGVVSCGIFARRPADVLLVGADAGVERFERARSPRQGEWP